MKRSILGLMYLIQGMRKAGVAVDQKLQSIGLRADALDPSSIIHPSLEWDVLKVIGQDVAPEKGLFIGQHYVLAGYGPLLMLLVTSDNVRIALEQGILYQSLTHLTGALSLKYTEHKVALCYEPHDLNSDLGLLRAQCEISGTYKFIQDLYKMMGLSIPQIHIDLPFLQPENQESLKNYYDYYGLELRFGSKCAEFWFDNAVLNV